MIVGSDRKLEIGLIHRVPIAIDYETVDCITKVIKEVTVNEWLNYAEGTYQISRKKLIDQLIGLDSVYFYEIEVLD